MIEVKNRSVESWGPLADCGDREFKSLINQLHAKDAIKSHLKKAKKLKTYKVTFEKRWYSDKFEIQAESEWDIGSAARAYFKEHGDKIGFKEQERSKWAGGYDGYDAISYVKVKSSTNK
jgi:hypothetical protein